MTKKPKPNHFEPIDIVSELFDEMTYSLECRGHKGRVAAERDQKRLLLLALKRLAAAGYRLREGAR